MTVFRLAFAAPAAALILSACITVEPQSTTGKAAIKTAGIVKKIRPERKPTMIIPASQRNYATDSERALACSKAGNSKARLVVIDESGNSQNVVSDVAIDCSAYNAPATITRAVDRAPVQSAPPPAYTTAQAAQPTLAGPRTIRVAVDGGPERIYEIDDTSGTARPVTQQGYEPAPQIFEAASRTPSYAPQSYRVRRGDTMYSIARRHCVSLDALSDSSGVYAPYVIDPGQSLRLPNGAC